ncbi:glycoside hydrolase family 99-like domain-containing protein, partial [Bacillus sp. S1-R5C1-FB]|uniref:glycoside hydrolase family 99-like domain-containing protein n=1 Tax=Bacillus sp. S1-R5C1-FB TaxID=1973491 RepID=UPI0015C4EF6F
YGELSDWKEHFDYLLQAFQDERYIRIDDKPLFIIYRTGHIPDCDQMLNYWNILAQENGLKGIYFVETLNSFPLPNINGFDDSIQFEPFYTIAHDRSSNINKTIYEYGKQINDWDYYKDWMYLLNRSPQQKKTYPYAFIDWDNTATRM